MRRHWHHGPPCGPPWARGPWHQRYPFRSYVRARLRRRLFAWFGVAIVLAITTGSLVMWAASAHEGGGWWREYERAQRFTGGQFARVWDRPAEREALARAIARDFEAGVSVEDASGAKLFGEGPSCGHRSFEADVVRDGVKLGTVRTCMDRHAEHRPWHIVLPLLAAAMVMWGVSGRVARRLARPLDDLARVAQEIGSGKLSARTSLDCREAGEVGVLADAINDMAARIERQVNDQRVLLAAVSHELRTPLGHMRLLLELARSGPAEPRTFDELEKEILEVDALVGQLLASARLDFAEIVPRVLDAGEVAKRALERAGITGFEPTVEADDPTFVAEPTLIARALANLLDNARKHAGGPTALRAAVRERAIAFEVEDEGPGFAGDDAEKVFEPFYRPSGEGSLGLGLSLVKRIAEAHGGRAYARNREKGAVVGFEIPLRTEA